MGEVYRAQDTKLGRDVAIKVLPSSVSGDHDRLARFEREARTLASLNHPNVAQVYGLEEGEAGQSGLFLVMELLEGHALSDLLADGALPTRKAIDYAGQIARGLAAAHDRSIVHRDLKPDNIFVLPDGRVKILDFGLARQTEGHASDNAGGTLITRDRFTNPGTVMGTAGYMSPEQVRAEATDARSDLFSLGVVLYEMLAGRRAFSKETSVETMTAILREDPPDLTTLRTDINPSLIRIVHRCLEKSPSSRFQTASDLAFALDAISGSTHGSGTQAVPQTPSMPLPAMSVADAGDETGGSQKPRKAKTNHPFIWAALGMSFGLAFLLVNRLLPESDDASPAPAAAVTAPVYRASVIFPEGVKVTDIGGFANRLALSPDGTKVAFIGGAKGEFRPPDRLWVLSLSDGSARELEGTSNAASPAWSPDSQHVLFSDRSAGVMKRVAAAGGQPVTVANRAGTSAWASDGSIVGFEYPPSPIGFTVPAAGGQAKDFFTGPKGQLIGYPTLLDDQRHFIVTSLGGTAPMEKEGLYVMDRNSDAVSFLTPGSQVNAFVDAGYLLYNEGRSLIARRFDQDKGEVESASLTLADDLSWATNSGAAFSVSKAGSLVYLPQPNQQTSRLIWMDRHGKGEAELGDVADYSNVELSPNDKRLLVSVMDPTRRARDLYVVDMDRGVRQRLTFDPGEERSAVWSHDGRRVVYSRDRELYERPSDFAGGEQPVLVNNVSKDPRQISSDGTRLLFRQNGQQSNDIWEMPLAGDRTPRALLNSQFDENYAGYSPDAKSMVYSSNEAGRPEVYVMSLDGSGGKTLISNQGGMFPRWRKDGREIVYLRPDQMLMAVAVTGSGATFRAGLATELFRIAPQPGAGSPFDLTADGKHFIVNTMVASRLPPSLTLIVNWPSLIAQQAK